MSYTIFNVIRDAVTGKLKFASRATASERIAICKDCEARDTKTNTCTACGCYLPWKTRLKDSACPMELW